MITLQSIRRIAYRWARSHKLDVLSAPQYPFHDYIHARFGLGTHEEGLVVEIEKSIEGAGWMDPRRWDIGRARQVCVTFGLYETERWSDARAIEVFERAKEVVADLKKIRGMVPYQPLSHTYMRWFLGIEMKNPRKVKVPDWVYHLRIGEKIIAV